MQKENVKINIRTNNFSNKKKKLSFINHNRVTKNNYLKFTSKLKSEKSKTRSEPYAGFREFIVAPDTKPGWGIGADKRWWKNKLKYAGNVIRTTMAFRIAYKKLKKEEMLFGKRPIEGGDKWSSIVTKELDNNVIYKNFVKKLKKKKARRGVILDRKKLRKLKKIWRKHKVKVLLTDINGLLFPTQFDLVNLPCFGNIFRFVKKFGSVGIQEYIRPMFKIWEYRRIRFAAFKQRLTRTYKSCNTSLVLENLSGEVWGRWMAGKHFTWRGVVTFYRRKRWGLC